MRFSRNQRIECFLNFGRRYKKMWRIFWRGQFCHMTPKRGSYYNYTLELCTGLHLVEFLILLKNIHFINSESKYLGVKLQLQRSKGGKLIVKCNLTPVYWITEFKKTTTFIFFKYYKLFFGFFSYSYNKIHIIR